jgi:hypothetical protein
VYFRAKCLWQSWTGMNMFIALMFYRAANTVSLFLLTMCLTKYCLHSRVNLLRWYQHLLLACTSRSFNILNLLEYIIVFLNGIPTIMPMTVISVQICRYCLGMSTLPTYRGHTALIYTLSVGHITVCELKDGISGSIHYMWDT